MNIALQINENLAIPNKHLVMLNLGLDGNYNNGFFIKQGLTLFNQKSLIFRGSLSLEYGLTTFLAFLWNLN